MSRVVHKGTICGTPFTMYRRVTRFMDKGCDGECHRYRGRYIVNVRPGLTSERELEVVIHELLHAADWTKDESWVHEAGEDISRVLLALGWVKGPRP